MNKMPKTFVRLAFEIAGKSYSDPIVAADAWARLAAVHAAARWMEANPEPAYPRYAVEVARAYGNHDVAARLNTDHDARVESYCITTRAINHRVYHKALRRVTPIFVAAAAAKTFTK